MYNYLYALTKKKINFLGFFEELPHPLCIVLFK